MTESFAQPSPHWQPKRLWRVGGHDLLVTPGSPLDRALQMQARRAEYPYPYYSTNPPNLIRHLWRPEARMMDEPTEREIEIMRRFQAKVSVIPNLHAKMAHAQTLVDPLTVPENERWTPEEARLFDEAAQEAWEALGGERTVLLPRLIARPLGITASNVLKLADTVATSAYAGTLVGTGGAAAAPLAGAKDVLIRGGLTALLKHLGTGGVRAGAKGEAVRAASFWGRHPALAGLGRTMVTMTGISLAQEAVGAVDPNLAETTGRVFDTYLNIKFPFFGPSRKALTQAVKGEIDTVPEAYVKELFRPLAEYSAYLPPETQQTLKEWVGHEREMIGQYAAREGLGIKDPFWQSLAGMGINMALGMAVRSGIGFTRAQALRGIEHAERMYYHRIIAGDRWPEVRKELKRYKVALNLAGKEFDPPIRALQRALFAIPGDTPEAKQRRAMIQQDIFDLMKRKADAVMKSADPMPAFAEIPTEQLRVEAAFTEWLKAKRKLSRTQYEKLPALEKHAVLSEFRIFNEANRVQLLYGGKLPPEYFTKPTKMPYAVRIPRKAERGAAYVGEPPPEELKVVRVPLREIDTTKFPYQTRKDKFDIERVARIIETYDPTLDRPILLNYRPDALHLVIGGHHRIMVRKLLWESAKTGKPIIIGGREITPSPAAKALMAKFAAEPGEATIDAVMVNVPDAHARYLSIQDNQFHKPFTPMELADLVAERISLYTKPTFVDPITGESAKGMTHKEAISRVAREFHEKASIIERAYDLSFLPPFIRGAVNNATLPLPLAQVYGEHIRRGRIPPELADALFLRLQEEARKGRHIGTSVEALHHIITRFPSPEKIPEQLTLFGKEQLVTTVVKSALDANLDALINIKRDLKHYRAVIKDLKKRPESRQALAEIEQIARELETVATKIQDELGIAQKWTKEQVEKVLKQGGNPATVGEVPPEPKPRPGAPPHEPPPLTVAGHKKPDGSPIQRPVEQVLVPNYEKPRSTSFVKDSNAFQHRLGGGVPAVSFEQVDKLYYDDLFRHIGKDLAVMRGDDPARGEFYVARIRKHFELGKKEATKGVVFTLDQQRRILRALENPDYDAVKATLTPEEYKVYQFYKKWDRIVWKIAHRIDPSVGYIKDHLFHVAPPGRRIVPEELPPEKPIIPVEKAAEQVGATPAEIAAIEAEMQRVLQEIRAAADRLRQAFPRTPSIWIWAQQAGGLPFEEQRKLLIGARKKVAQVVKEPELVKAAEVELKKLEESFVEQQDLRHARQKMLFDQKAWDEIRAGMKGVGLRAIPKLSPEDLRNVPSAPYLFWTTRAFGDAAYILTKVNPYNPVSQHVFRVLMTVANNRDVERRRLAGTIEEAIKRLGVNEKQMRRALEMAINPKLYVTGTPAEQELASLYSAAIGYLETRGAVPFTRFFRLLKRKGVTLPEALDFWFKVAMRQIHVDPVVPELKTLVAQLGPSYTDWFENYYLPYVTGKLTLGRQIAESLPGKIFTAAFAPRLQYAAGMLFNLGVGLKNFTQGIIYGLIHALREGGVLGAEEWVKSYGKIFNRLTKEGRLEWERLKKLAVSAGVFNEKELPTLFEQEPSLFGGRGPLAKAITVGEKIGHFPIRWTEAINKMTAVSQYEAIGKAKGLSGDALLDYIFDNVNRIHFVSADMNMSWAQMNPMMRPFMAYKTFPIRSIELISGLFHEASQSIRGGRNIVRGIKSGLEAAGILTLAIPGVYYGARAIGLDPLVITFPGVETVADRWSRFTSLYDLSPAPLRVLVSLLKMDMDPEKVYLAAREYARSYFPGSTQIRRILRYIEEQDGGWAVTREGQLIAPVTPMESFLKLIGLPLQKINVEYDSATRMAAVESEYRADKEDAIEAFMKYREGKLTREGLRDALIKFERKYPEAFRTHGKKDAKKIEEFLRSVRNREEARATPLAMERILNLPKVALPTNAPPEFYQDLEKLRTARSNFRKKIIDRDTMLRMWEKFKMEWDAVIYKDPADVFVEDVRALWE